MMPLMTYNVKYEVDLFVFKNDSIIQNYNPEVTATFSVRGSILIYN